MVEDVLLWLVISAVQAQYARGHMWVGLLFGLLVATILGLLLIVLIHRRSKESQFG